LDPFYVPLGAHSWSFYVAVLSLHAVVAGLIVAAAWRNRGPALAVVTSALLLLYLRTVGESVFRTIWPPFAPILPMILFFILAAAGAAGSTPAMLGALIAGSFVVQVHVSTVPLVLSVLATMGALRLGTVLLDRRATAPPRQKPVPQPVPPVLTV